MDTKQEGGMMEGYGKRRRSSEAEEMDKDQGYSMKEGMEQWRRRRDAFEGDMTDSEQGYGMKEGLVEKRRRSAGKGEMDKDRGYGMHAGYGGYGRTGAGGGGSQIIWKRRLNQNLKVVRGGGGHWEIWCF